MSRPRLDHRAEGLTRPQVAKQLRVSPSYVRKLQAKGYLSRVTDGNGVYRITPHEVSELARKLGRDVETDGEIAARVYGYFLDPAFRAKPEQLARVVHETRQHPDVVLSLLEKFRTGAGPNPGEREEAEDFDRLAREYEEQIKALDTELARKRRATFIRGDGEGEE
jgi:transcriptional regulator with XRE-family HTH domain